MITVQSDGGLNFDKPVPICFPNLPNPTTKKPWPPGTKGSLISFNHKKGVWEDVGDMTVSADGKFFCTDPGVGILQPGWHGTKCPKGKTPPKPEPKLPKIDFCKLLTSETFLPSYPTALDVCILLAKTRAEETRTKQYAWADGQVKICEALKDGLPAASLACDKQLRGDITLQKLSRRIALGNDLDKCEKCFNQAPQPLSAKNNARNVALATVTAPIGDPVILYAAIG